MVEEEVKHILLVFNPHAASKRASRLLKPILEEFKIHNIDVSLRVTRHQNHGIEIVIEEDLEKYDAIIAAGGDGTLFDVVNGLFRRKDNIAIPIGIIPIGTGNAFARDLDLNTNNIKKAIELVAGFKTMKVDVGYFNTAGEDHYFMNILGLGFVADVAKTSYRLKWMGNIAYTLGVLWEMIFLKKYDLKITIDDVEYNEKNTFVEISNSRYTSNFLMAPNAEIDDGLLDITLLNGVSRIKMIKAFPKIFTGEHIHLEEVKTFKAKDIKIQTKKAKILTPDGELFGITPIDVKCLPGAIRMFC